MREQDLQPEHHQRPGDRRRIGKQTDPKHRSCQGAAIEQVEQFADHDHVRGSRLGLSQGGPLDVEHPFEQPERADQQQQADQPDSFEQPRVQDRRPGPTRRTLHDPWFLRLEYQHQTERQRGHHVDPQNLDRRDRQLRPQQDREQDDHPFADVRRQGPDDELGEVVEDAPAFLDGGADRGEVIVGQDHVGGLPRDIRASLAHRHPDVGLLQGRRVVDAIPRHRHHVAAGLQGANQTQLLLRRDTGEDRHPIGHIDQLFVAQFSDLLPRHCHHGIRARTRGLGDFIGPDDS